MCACAYTSADTCACVHVHAGAQEANNPAVWVFTRDFQLFDHSDLDYWSTFLETSRSFWRNSVQFATYLSDY